MKIMGSKAYTLLVSLSLMLAVGRKTSGVLASAAPQAAPDFATIDAYIEAQMSEARIPGARHRAR